MPRDNQKRWAIYAPRSNRRLTKRALTFSEARDAIEMNQWKGTLIPRGSRIVDLVDERARRQLTFGF